MWFSMLWAGGWAHAVFPPSDEPITSQSLKHSEVCYTSHSYRSLFLLKRKLIWVHLGFIFSRLMSQWFHLETPRPRLVGFHPHKQSDINPLTASETLITDLHMLITCWEHALIGQFRAPAARVSLRSQSHHLPSTERANNIETESVTTKPKALRRTLGGRV